MKHRLLSKIISAVIVAVIQNSIFYMMDVHRAEMGRDRFIAQQTARYNRTVANASFVHYLIPSLLLLGIMLVMYEFFAFATCKFLDKIFNEKSKL